MSPKQLEVKGNTDMVVARRFFQRLSERTSLLLRYHRFLGTRQMWHLLVSRLFRVRRRVEVRIAETTVTIRTCTPDLHVAMSSLAFGEYDHIDASRVRFIVDAGAHIGTASIALARRFPQSQILAIEPEEENFQILQENVGRFDNIRPLKLALWGSSGTLPISDRDSGPWGYTVAQSRQPSTPTGQLAQCVTVDELMNEFAWPEIDILKMDIEGAEKSVFEHSDSWIRRVKVLAVELHDRIVPGSGDSLYHAVRSFQRLEENGEKVVAYR